MTWVAVTMMQWREVSRDEWRDAIDARWSAFLARCGLRALYLPNDPLLAESLLRGHGAAGVVLTGGGDCEALSGHATARDQVEALAIDWAAAGARPVLGVCRGMQVLAARAGGRLETVHGHVNRLHAVEGEGAMPRWVNSYHAYGLRQAPPGFHVVATAADGVVEAMRRADGQQAGIMWHPERQAVAEPSDVHLFRSLFEVRA